MERIYPNRHRWIYVITRILHVTFTDKVKADIPTDVSSGGPAFSEEF